MKPVQLLQPQANVIDLLERLLVEARSGELRSIVCFGEYASRRYRYNGSGSLNTGAIIVAFEHWKLDTLLEKNHDQ